MRVCRSLTEFTPPAGGVVLTIGNFDGVHRGHARLIEAARQVAARLGAETTVLTLEPHPLAVLAPERAPATLTTLAEKLALLDRLGVSSCIVLNSTPALLSQHAVDFLASLVAHCRPRAFVEGPDFNFGRARSGNIATLKEHAGRWGYEVHVVSAVRCDELPTSPIISSSSVRQALLDGRITEANAMLGRPYRIVGTTGSGAGRGAALGFPTANLDGILHLLPQQAVYAAAAQFEDRSLHPAAVNVGPQPTFGQETCRVEVHILGMDCDLRGRRIGVHFLARLRGQMRFETQHDLVRQISHDVEQVRACRGQIEALVRNSPIAL